MYLPSETVYHPGRAAAEERAVRLLCKTLMVNAIDALPGVEIIVTPAKKVCTESRGGPVPQRIEPEGFASRPVPTMVKVGKNTASID